MDYVSKLKEFGRKSITKEQLEKIFSLHDDEDLFQAIKKLNEEGLLKPVIASRTNGNVLFPVYMKYKVTMPETNAEKEKAEISTLHPLLLINGTLYRNVNYFVTYKNQLKKLSKYLFERQNPITPISRKERSFEIFSEEKKLEDKTFCRLLKKLNLTEKTLFYYDTPEYCFNDFIPERKDSMTLLICENKDIWFNLRRIMFENKVNMLFNVPIDGVIYGCGNKICEEGALSAYTEFMHLSYVKYLYWGDIDKSGLDIYLRLLKANIGLNINLFVCAYNEMLRLSQGREIPNSEDLREHDTDYSSIFELFESDLRVILEKSINDNKRIPQEIISYKYLQETMR